MVTWKDTKNNTHLPAPTTKVRTHELYQLWEQRNRNNDLMLAQWIADDNTIFYRNLFPWLTFKKEAGQVFVNNVFSFKRVIFSMDPLQHQASHHSSKTDTKALFVSLYKLVHQSSLVLKEQLPWVSYLVIQAWCFNKELHSAFVDSSPLGIASVSRTLF